MSKPALSLASAGGEPRRVTRISAMVRLGYLEAAEMDALGRMIATPIGDTDALVGACEVLRAIEEQRRAAERRLRRAELEDAGRRWLEACR